MIFSLFPSGLKIENAIKIIHALTNVSLSKQLIDTRRHSRARAMEENAGLHSNDGC